MVTTSRFSFFEIIIKGLASPPPNWQSQIWSLPLNAALRLVLKLFQQNLFHDVHRGFFTCPDFKRKGPLVEKHAPALQSF